MKAGIELVKADTIQPFRVWWDSHIVWFAKTALEANKVYTDCKKGIRPK